jgi:hypothetical protein
MKIGPIDLNQPSTWRGMIGLSSVFGIACSPELAAQIALVAAGLVSLIEMLRNEYNRRKTDSLPPIELQATASYRVTDGVGVVARDRVSDLDVQTSSTDSTHLYIERTTTALPKESFSDSFGDK